jgi:tRNA threonylcarbamoyladenosine biosynthesis protein TsaB
MLVLAIDTALDACSTIIVDDARGVLAGETLPMARGHAEALMPQIARVMAEAKLAFSALDRIAVTVGPGSFTGLRVGVSAARGIALAANKPAVGVSTLQAIATPLTISDESIPVVVVIDARNDQAYTQAFGGKGGGALNEARIALLRDAFDGLPDGPVRVVGSAAQKLAALGLRETFVERGTAPEPYWVAALGASASIDTPPKPLYLHAPHVKPQQTSRLVQQ